MKGSRIIQQSNTYKGKTITLRGSYSMLTPKLANFPKCFPNDFKGLNIQKNSFHIVIILMKGYTNEVRRLVVRSLIRQSSE